MLLVGDVGGTHARFALCAQEGAASAETRLINKATLAAADFNCFADAIWHYLRSISVHPNDLRGASLAIAAPLGDDEVRFTNSPWHFSRTELQRTLQLGRLTLINDFEALAYSVPQLTGDHLQPLRTGDLQFARPKLVLGPGTGLGVAGLVPVRVGVETRWQPVPGEGGHMAFAPYDDFEVDLLRHLRSRYDRVSAERLICGDGLVAVHAFLHQRSTSSSRHAASAADITRDALRGDDALAREAVMRFLAMLGSFAGDCALLYAAQGGVYFGGGILPRMSPLLDSSPLIERFDAKGRMSQWVSRIPLHMIVDDAAALRGAAIAEDIAGALVAADVAARAH